MSTLSSSRITLGSLASVHLLNSTASTYIALPTPTQDSAGLHVTLPSASAPFSALAYALKLTFSGQVPSLQPLAGAQIYQDVDYSGSGAVLAIGNHRRPAGARRTAQPEPVLAAAGPRVPDRRLLGGQLHRDGLDVHGGQRRSADDRNNDAVASLKVQFNPAIWFRITNVTDGLVLDGGGNVPSGSPTKQWSGNGSTNLRWTFTAV